MPAKDETQLNARSINTKSIIKEYVKTFYDFIGFIIFIILLIEGLSIYLLKNYHEIYMNTLQLISYDLELLILSLNLLYICYYFIKINITVKIALIAFIFLTLSNLIFPFIDLDYKTYLFWFQSLSVGSGLASLLIGGISWRMKSRT